MYSMPASNVLASTDVGMYISPPSPAPMELSLITIFKSPLTLRRLISLDLIPLRINLSSEPSNMYVSIIVSLPSPREYIYVSFLAWPSSVSLPLPPKRMSSLFPPSIWSSPVLTSFQFALLFIYERLQYVPSANWIPSTPVPLTNWKCTFMLSATLFAKPITRS